MAIVTFLAYTQPHQDAAIFDVVSGLLFPKLKVPGFLDNFPVACDAYSSGLYFPPDCVSQWLDAYNATQASFVQLGMRVTGYDELSVQVITSVIHECLLWCHRPMV